MESLRVDGEFCHRALRVESIEDAVVEAGVGDAPIFFCNKQLKKTGNRDRGFGENGVSSATHGGIFPRKFLCAAIGIGHDHIAGTFPIQIAIGRVEERQRGQARLPWKQDFYASVEREQDGIVARE